MENVQTDVRVKRVNKKIKNEIMVVCQVHNDLKTRFYDTEQQLRLQRVTENYVFNTSVDLN